ncbi:MAG: AzlD domain-containing protein [Acidimicrobiia bacterium]
MPDLVLILLMAAITFASRAIFLIWPRPAPVGLWGRFLETFPLALFVALATIGLAAPDGDVQGSVALVAAAGGVAGAALTKRSVLGVLLIGGTAYWAARWLT